MEPVTHYLKSWAHFYDAIEAGEKMYDLRDARDREFNIGDYVLLQRYDMVAGVYTGEELLLQISYITDRDTPCALSSVVLSEGFAILGYQFVHEDETKH